MREYHEIRLDLGADGTGDAAAPYISAARVQLGVLKNRMALGGLQQGSLSKILPDGTQIMVSSSFGRDVVRIVAAAAVAAALAAASVQPAEAAPKPDMLGPITLGPSFIVTGSLQDAATYTAHAVIWVGGAPKFAPVFTNTSSGFASEATAVSADGQWVAGYHPDPSTGYDVAFRWRVGGSAQDIYNAGTADVKATDMTADGRTVVGYVLAGGPDSVWVWTAAGGLRFLTDLGYGAVETPGEYNQYNWPVAISPNGQYIVANLRTDLVGGQVAAVWTNGGTTLTTLPTPTGWYPMRVNNAGQIVGATGSGSSSAVLWDVPKNTYTLLGSGHARGIGDRAVVGSDLGNVNWFSNAWYLAPGNIQTLLDADSVATGVAKDGHYICGVETTNASGMNLPVYWVGGHKHYLQVPTGYVQGATYTVVDNIRPTPDTIDLVPASLSP